MKNFENFLGVDVGKHILEYCLINIDNQVVNKGKANDNEVSLGKFFSQLELNGYSKSEVLIIFENTGIYSNPLSHYLHENQWSYSEVPALEIKRSKGLSRGKSDRTDARDIAVCGLRNKDKITLSTEPQTLYRQLKILATEREKILAAILSFSRTSEAEKFLGKEVFKAVKVVNRQTIAALKKQLKSVVLFKHKFW